MFEVNVSSWSDFPEEAEDFLGFKDFPLGANFFLLTKSYCFDSSNIFFVTAHLGLGFVGGRII